MYKTKLQELCHKRGWDLPEYETRKEGQDHDPRFHSKVVVNGQTFVSQADSKSSKVAQNDAAKLAFEFFSSPPPPLPPPPISLIKSGSSISMSGLKGDCGPSSGAASAMSEQNLNQTIETAVSIGVAAVPINDSRFRDASHGTTEPNLNHGGVMHGQVPVISQSPHNIGLNGVAAVTMNDDKFREVQGLCKNHLQIYAQKNKLRLPVYTCERIGPPHATRFKCKVTINGQTYESQDLLSTKVEAEHAAAKVALMSLPSDVVKEDESGYKNLLQELAQKEGYQLPTYATYKSGEAHMPIFVSTVEIEGESFTGREAGSKKQAEMSAARVAYTAIRLRNSNGASGHHSSVCEVKESPRGSSSSGVLPDLATQQNVQPTVLLPSETAEGKFTGSAESSSRPQDIFMVPKKSIPSADALSSASPSKQEPSSPITDSPTSVVINSSIDQLVERSSLCHKGIVVHARETNVAYPAGTTLSPLSNDSWTVAEYKPVSTQ